MKIGVGSKNKTKVNAVAIEGILHKGMDGSQAMKAIGVTKHDKLGEHEGMIGIFTRGRSNRTEYNKGAVVMALMHLENPEHY